MPEHGDEGGSVDAEYPRTLGLWNSDDDHPTGPSRVSAETLHALPR